MLKNIIILLLLLITGVLGFIVHLSTLPPVPNYEFDSFPDVILSNNDTIIEVVYIHFACECPRWVDYEYYIADGDIGYCQQESNCFEIICSKEAAMIPDSIYIGANDPSFKLYGRFHKYKPEEQIGEQRRDYIPFFQYDSYELVRSSNSQPSDVDSGEL